MKRKVMISFCLVVVLLLPGSAGAWYYAVGGGTGGGADAESFSFEFGREDIRIRDFNTLAGVAVPLIFHGDDNVPDSTLDSGCPHDDCRNLGDKEEGTETGLLGRFGMELYDWDAFVSVILGVTRANTVSLSRSNVTGNYYKESSGDETNGVYGIGFSYLPEFFEWRVKMIFSIDIDNRRGITGMIGWRW